MDILHGLLLAPVLEQGPILLRILHRGVSLIIRYPIRVALEPVQYEVREIISGD